MNDQEAVLATVVTALLIREGGQVTLTKLEWDAAVDHQGNLFIHRDNEDDPMVVALMHKTVEA